MRGIILSGGSATRLRPCTKVTSKQLLPVYNRPMIYYPLNTLLKAGIKEILIIVAPERAGDYLNLLGSGRTFGAKFTYEIQDKPEGIAQAFIIGENFIGDVNVALILGDNIFYGAGFSKLVQSFNDVNGAAVFAYEVNDPERYGVVAFNDQKQAISIEEKPKQPKSNYAVPGLYFYDNSVVEIAKNIAPSPRGEYEITDVNRVYLEKGTLQVGIMNRGTAWLDTGTFDSFADACEFVRVIEKRQSQKVGCIEEVAYRMGFIDRAQLMLLGEKYAKSGYGEYLKRLKVL